MHYNAARFYTELKDRSLPRFGIAVGSSFGISAAVYMAIASFGYLTFGGNCSGFILNNYSPYDPLATVSRIAVGVAVLVRPTSFFVFWWFAKRLRVVG
jgi:amino acid permease